MKPEERTWRSRVIRLLIAASVLLFVIGCGQTDKLSEFEGIVVAKRTPADILVLPDVDAIVIQNMTEAELLAMAIAQNGVYFSVGEATFESVIVGSKVIVQYDPDDGEEATIPPRRRSQGVEIVTSSGATP
jgi:hypothetical protein